MFQPGTAKKIRSDVSGMEKDLPQRMILELSRVCRANCPFCALTYQEPALGVMNKQTFGYVRPFLDQVEEVTLFGFGESLENPDFEFIFREIAAFNRLRTYLLTNGQLLDQFADLLVEKRLDYLAVSIDGARKETYESLRPGLSFDRIIENVLRIQKRKRLDKSEVPQLRFTFVGMKRNLHEFTDLIRLAGDLGVAEVKFIFLVAHDEHFLQESLFPHPEMYQRVWSEAQEVAEEKGIRLLLPTLQASGSETPFHRECLAAWDDFFVGADGTVRPCMISDQTLGNVRKNTVPEIFNGKAFQDFRKVVNGPAPPAACQNCWHSSYSNLHSPNSHFHKHPALPDSIAASLLDKN